MKTIPNIEGLTLIEISRILKAHPELVPIYVKQPDGSFKIDHLEISEPESHRQRTLRRTHKEAIRRQRDSNYCPR